jgi:Tol biopolymer transport system component
VNRLLLAGVLLAACGCAPTPGETTYLSDGIQLTRGFARAGEAYFSPDMNWFIFQAIPAGESNYQMYVACVLRTDGKITGTGVPTQITPTGSKNTCGYFSADGKGLVFASTGARPPASRPAGPATGRGRYRWDFEPGMEIYFVGDWPQALDEVRPGAKVGLIPAARRLTTNDVYDAECAISPDGRWIVYCSMESGDGDVYVMRTDGSQKARITSAPGYDGGPFFSPDGRRLVYRSDRRGDDKLQLFVCDLAFDGAGNITGMKSERQITHNDHVNWGPYWHPDGRHIIYATSRHGHDNYELYLVRDDGSRDTRITYGPGADVLPVFSPDGKWLMWTSRRSSDGSPQIVAARFRMP